MLVHSVFFWLKSGEDRAAFRRQVETLARIPGLVACHVGTPAATGKRPVIDDTYDVALTVIMPDVATHDAYQVHPLHLAFLGACKERWTRVQVYDAQ
jgi:hypothetical protein